MSEQRRRLAAIMVTDMVGYSALAQRDEALALDLLDEQRRILRALFVKFGGREIDAVGDGFLAEFPSAVDAAQCAIEIQRSLSERNSGLVADRRVLVRIGLHLGDVVVREDRVQGDGVNIAARIEPLAFPGGICVSEDVARQIQNKILLPLRKLGKGELKNIQLPVDIYRVVLPWERGPRQLSDRLAFALRRAHTRRTILAALLVLIAGGLAAWFWVDKQASGTWANKNRVAVLPFANISADPKDEYFADGMTEEMISALSKIRKLEVIARTSVMQYKGKARNVADIGRELRVGTILEGSVRKDGPRLRITAQLINSQNQAHLWSQEYDRELKSVFAIQSDIAERVAQALRVRLAEAERGRIERPSTQNLEAHNLYLLGRYERNKLTREGSIKSVGYFQQAIEKDPTYARAFAGLSMSYHQLGAWGFIPSSEVIPKAKAAALKALGLDDTLGEALGSLAYMRGWYDRDWAGEERDYKRALALNPNDAITQFTWAVYLLMMGRSDEAIVEMKRARDLDPLSMIVNSGVGFAFYSARQYDRAIEEYRRVLQLDPSFVVVHWWLAFAYAQQKRYDEALAEGRIAAGLEKVAPLRDAYLGYLYGLAGRRDEALRALARLEEAARRQYVSPQWIAYVYMGLGDKDRAIELLQKSVDTERLEAQALFKASPFFDPLRSDPRFHRVLRSMNLESY